MQLQLEKKHVLLGSVVLVLLSIVIAFVYPMSSSFIGGALLMCVGLSFIVKCLERSPFKCPSIAINQKKWGGVMIAVGITISLTFCSIFGVESKTTGQENFFHVAVILIGLIIIALGFYIANKTSDEWD